MTLLDTSILVDSLSGTKNSARALRAAIDAGERLVVPALVLYEWLRGPRLAAEIEMQEALFPSASVVVFGSREAALSAKLYRSLKRARGREIGIAIAACAIVRDAPLWTLNKGDFRDIAQLQLARF
jgi:predicted nucleic acid-binding protein